MAKDKKKKKDKKTQTREIPSIHIFLKDRGNKRKSTNF